jgi:flagellar biosynthetic protein FliP
MLAMLAIGSAVALTAQAIPGPGNSQPLGKELQGISSQLQGNTAQANGNAAQLQGNAALLQGILGGKAGQPQSLPAMSVAPQRRLSSGPRITSQPVPPASTSADIGGVMQVPGIPGGSVPWSVVVMLTALTLIPSILVCMTPFARLLIVFHFLRQALGLQTTPSNQTLIGLSLILTFFLMQPTAMKIYEQALAPMESGQITAIDALAKAADPMRQFMGHYVRDKDVALFSDLAKEPRPASINDVSMRVLLPSYILSELKAGFQIGTVLFLPFLIVDMVVASITTSVGMLQLPPVVISTPLKLLLFLMVDGWHLLIGSLMRSFN